MPAASRDDVRSRLHPFVVPDSSNRSVAVKLLTSKRASDPKFRHAFRNEIRLVLSTDSAGRAVVEVRDSGRGIPAEVLPAIFEPYVQLAPHATGATGLGLAIARDLALGMGGDVTVTSTVDMGSSFVLHLPSPPGTPRAPFDD